jgi:hypothetical protein
MSDKKKKKQIHTLPNPNGGWDNKKPGASRVSSHSDTKAEAEKIGGQIARNQNLEHITHNKDGKISNPDSFGNDPRSIKDKKL